jgi:predicted DNA-binding transcriptional regulator YafY
MKKAERLNGIIYALKERGKLNCKELSELFEVSERTIYRDVDALSQLKVPLISYEGKKGGYEIEDDYFIPSIQLAEEEVIMLLMVLNMGKEIKIPNMGSEYQLLRSKIINVLTEPNRKKVNQLLKHVSFYVDRLLPKDYSEKVLPIILESFMEGKNIFITYYVPANGNMTERKVSPTELFYSDGGWYVTGFCHNRLEKRTFRLDRIGKIELVDEINVYLGKEIQSTYDKFVFKEYHFEISKPLYRLIRENFYMENCTVLAEGEKVEVQLLSKYEEEMTNLILSNPHDIKLLGPEPYKEHIRKLINELYHKYI